MDIQQAKNSIYGYIVGDILGVPYEFRAQGTFKCRDYIGGGTYGKPFGTWSDDTTILLCLLDSLTNYTTLDSSLSRYKENLRSWLFDNKFTADNECFDIGNQTRQSILANFILPETDRMGNGALFYSLPLAMFLIYEDGLDVRRNVVSDFCRVTHNNRLCQEYVFALEEHLRTLFLGGEISVERRAYENKGDVVNTYFLVIDQFLSLISRSESTLLDKLCRVVDLGNDTDTNAAFVGALLGANGDIASNYDMSIIRNFAFVEGIVDKFLAQNRDVF